MVKGVKRRYREKEKAGGRGVQSKAGKKKEDGGEGRGGSREG